MSCQWVCLDCQDKYRREGDKGHEVKTVVNVFQFHCHVCGTTRHAEQFDLVPGEWAAELKRRCLEDGLRLLETVRGVDFTEKGEVWE